MSLCQTIADLRAELVTNPFGDLPLWARLRLWRAMEAEFPRDGSLRRSYFALFVLDRLLPAWDGANMPLPYRDLPHLLQHAARLHLNGVTSRESVASIRDDCSKVHQHFVCACDWETYGDVRFVQFAAEFVADRVLGSDDDDYRRLEMYDQLEIADLTERPTEWLMADGIHPDTHFIGSLVAANGAHWESDRCNNEARRAYWRIWLDDWLPQFLGDIQAAGAASKCLRDPYLNHAHSNRPNIKT